MFLYLYTMNFSIPVTQSPISSPTPSPRASLLLKGPPSYPRIFLLFVVQLKFRLSYCLHVGERLWGGTRATYLWLQQWRRWHPSATSFMDLSLTHNAMLIGSILDKCWVINHNCKEFMHAMLWSCSEDTIFIAHLQFFCSFCLLICHVFWVLERDVT